MDTPAKKAQHDARVTRVLGKTKGKTIEALEKAEAAIKAALQELRREEADALLSSDVRARIAQAKVHLSRVTALQTYGAGYKLGISHS